MLEEGVDFYIDEESGLMVLTSLFLKKRGFCCAKKCKECPYDPPREIKGNTNLQHVNSENET